MSAIYIEECSLRFGAHQLFTNLNLQIPIGKWVALLGPSGVGKTQLLRLMAGLPTAGTVSVKSNLPELQNDIAFMAQNDLLLPWLTLSENISLPLKLKNHVEPSSYTVASLLHQVGLSAFSHYYPRQLSGGMKQRAALARTLIQNKPIILMDEPFSAVDALTRLSLQQLSAQLLADKTVIFITHDPLEAVRLADIIYILQGSPAQLTPAFTFSPTHREAMNSTEVFAYQAKLYALLETSWREN